ncbi:MAG TPA: ABC transporter permease [Actinomycetes bacterium]|nr:ABC transporter permease [Actinomycetes bacterium]
MSTQTSAVPAVKFGSAVPLARLTRVELRKMTDTRAGLWLFIAIGVLTAAAIVLFAFFAPPEDLTYPNFAGVALTPQGFLLPILGILLITSEWGQRTGLVTFALEPNRGRVVRAKVIAAVLVALAAVALLLVVAAVGNLAGAQFQDGPGDWQLYRGRGLSYTLILQLSGIIQGLAFGMLLMNSAAAIVSYFAVPIGFSITFNMVSALQDVAPWLDLGTAQQPLFEFDQALSGRQWAQLAVTTAIWIGLPLALGYRRLERAEIKSA